MTFEKARTFRGFFLNEILEAGRVRLPGFIFVIRVLTRNRLGGEILRIVKRLRGIGRDNLWWISSGVICNLWWSWGENLHRHLFWSMIHLRGAVVIVGRIGLAAISAELTEDSAGPYRHRKFVCVCQEQTR